MSEQLHIDVQQATAPQEAIAVTHAEAATNPQALLEAGNLERTRAVDPMVLRSTGSAIVEQVAQRTGSRIELNPDGSVKTPGDVASGPADVKARY